MHQLSGWIWLHLSKKIPWRKMSMYDEKTENVYWHKLTINLAWLSHTWVSLPLFGCPFSVNTRRFLDVDSTFFNGYGRQMDVEITFCAFTGTDHIYRTLLLPIWNNYPSLLGCTLSLLVWFFLHAFFSKNIIIFL